MNIIGVVKDSRFPSLREATAPLVYQTFLQASTGFGAMTLHVVLSENRRTDRPSDRAAVQAVDKDVPMSDIHSLADEVDAALVRERLVATLSGIFGVVALVLICVGLYGLMAFSVARRTTEIGVRVALGATRADVRRLDRAVKPFACWPSASPSGCRPRGSRADWRRGSSRRCCTGLTPAIPSRRRRDRPARAGRPRGGFGARPARGQESIPSSRSGTSSDRPGTRFVANASTERQQPPPFVEKTLRLDKQRQIPIVVARLRDVHDRPVGQLRRLHGVVRLIVKREAAVDDDVFPGIERIGEDEHRSVTGVELLAAGDHAVGAPRRSANWSAIRL